MIKKILMLFLPLFIGGFYLPAQKVTQVVAEQDGDMIVIRYSLDKPTTVRLYVSSDSGKTYIGPLKSVTGDVDYYVQKGERSIRWNPARENIKLSSAELVFKVVPDILPSSVSIYDDAPSTDSFDEILLKSTDDDGADGQKGTSRTITFATLDIAFPFANQFSYGFTVGRVRRWGWYVSLMSNFYNFRQLAGIKTMQTGTYNLNGETAIKRFSAMAGVAVRVARPLVICVGAGYGNRTLACQTVEGNWYAYPGRTFVGVDAEIGLLFKIKAVAFSVKAVTTNFKYGECKIGVGIAL